PFFIHASFINLVRSASRGGPSGPTAPTSFGSTLVTSTLYLPAAIPSPELKVVMSNEPSFPEKPEAALPSWPSGMKWTVAWEIGLPSSQWSVPPILFNPELLPPQPAHRPRARGTHNTNEILCIRDTPVTEPMRADGRCGSPTVDTAGDRCSG